jgi:hypothetical protein
MGVFQAVPTDGTSVTATSLAERLGVEKDLLGTFQPTSIYIMIMLITTTCKVRLMRVVTANGPFAEVGREEYAHTPYSMIYLVPGISNLFKTR